MHYSKCNFSEDSGVQITKTSLNTFFLSLQITKYRLRGLPLWQAETSLFWFMPMPSTHKHSHPSSVPTKQLYQVAVTNEQRCLPQYAASCSQVVRDEFVCRGSAGEQVGGGCRVEDGAWSPLSLWSHQLFQEAE